LIEIRIIGLGGQGAVMGAEILADSAFREGKWSQMIPSYGGQRRGGIAQGFVRLDDKMISLNSPVRTPDILVILDPKILSKMPATQGLKEGGMAVLNSEMSPDEVDLGIKLSKIATVNATKISRSFLGMQPIPITNTTMIGAFCKATELIKLQTLYPKIKEVFPGKTGDVNVSMAETGFKECKVKKMGGSD
jgi:2-oxoacid:acceptor oxidoreductase gamma subunit (pyruvate/2-ketoisovalerate family)